MKEALIQTSLVLNWERARRSGPDQREPAVCRLGEVEHIALCLQQVQYVLSSSQTSMLDVAVWIADLANVLGPDQTLEEAIQQLVAINLASQLEARRSHKREIEQERQCAHQ